MLRLDLIRSVIVFRTPCSVNAMGLYLVPPQLEVSNWLLKLFN